jgi:serine/threonine protein phosphatase PrpC
VTLALRYAARSDRGLVRANNEDSVYAGARLLALADGMGGHAAGVLDQCAEVGRGGELAVPGARGRADWMVQQYEIG